jgi:hypothetical protein
MIRQKICFVAEGVLIDSHTGQASAFNILEGIQAGGFPLFIQKSAFFCLWERDDTDASQYRAVFTVTLGNEEIARQNLDIDFLEKIRNRSIVYLNGIVIPRPGLVVFRLSVPEHATAEYTIEIISTPQVHQAVQQGVTP